MTSDAGVVPEFFTSTMGGGDLKCLDLDASFTGSAHFEGVSEEEPEMTEMTADVTAVPAVILAASEGEDDEHDHEEPPAGLEFEVDGPEVSWSSTFPIAAVIVKGGADTNAYRYDPALLSDSGLITPPNESGNPADVSSIRFCWTGDADEPDLIELCEAAAAGEGVGPIESFAGPILVRDGAVVTESVPGGIGLNFDAMTEIVAFTAPFPVVTVVTAASDPVLHAIAPVATEGTVELSSNPGDGDVVLCGLAVLVTDDPSDDDSSTGVTSTDATTDGTADATDAAEDPALQSMGDPTTIPTGGGPSGRTALALIAFVVLALTGSTSLLVWSRGG
jgi:hypothetical protein